MILVAKIILAFVAFLFAALVGRESVKASITEEDKAYALFCLVMAIAAGIAGNCL